jgi:hypothetical protein
MAWLLRRPEVSALAAALTGPGTGKPGSAMRPMAVAALPTVMPRSVAAATAAELVAGIVATAAAGLTHRELGQRPRILLAFGPRKRCANQRAMDRTFLHVRDGRQIGFRFVRFNFPVVNAADVLGNKRGRYSDRLVVRFVESGRDVGGSLRRVSVRLSRQDLFVESGRRFLLLAARCLAALVWMFGVAGRTTCLLDVLFDHGYDRVIRHPTLTRTVVVQYVSETQPTLLH